MCKGRVSFTVNCDGVEGVCGEHEVLLISLLMRPGSDCGQSCEQVNEVWSKDSSAYSSSDLAQSS